MTFQAHRCANDHPTYPAHRRCPECGRQQTETVDLRDAVGEVVTWTRSTATPPGVRQPNRLAIIEFVVDGEPVQAIGGTTVPVEIGDEVEPVYVEELHDPEAGIRNPDSQAWDGYRFAPVQE